VPSMIQSSKTTLRTRTTFSQRSIVSSKYKWLDQKLWGESHISFASTMSQFKSLNLLQAPPSAFFLKNTKLFRGQWVLEQTEQPNETLGWAEAHGYQLNFSTFFLMFYLSPKTESFEQLSLLVSSLFISGHCDQIRLVNLSQSTLCQQLATIAKEEKILSFDKKYLEQSPLIDPQRYFSTYTISAEQWWSTEQATNDKLHLSHMIKKEDLKQRKKQRTTPKKSRSLLGRLFGRY